MGGRPGRLVQERIKSMPDLRPLVGSYLVHIIADKDVGSNTVVLLLCYCCATPDICLLSTSIGLDFLQVSNVSQR